MPLDPDAEAYLNLLRDTAVPGIEDLTPAEARANAERSVAAAVGRPIEIARVEDLTVPGPAGPLPARLYSDRREPGVEPVLVFFHGGGWVTGSLDTHDVVGRSLARLASCAVIAVDYRLAPEHPYPAAVEDAWAAVDWVARGGAGPAVDAARLAVGGDSAGGTLAAAVALRARDARMKLATQLLVYPVLDGGLQMPSYAVNATGFGLTKSAMAAYWDHYAPDPRRRLEPEASPLRAADLSGLAPALIVVCEFDPLLDEGVAYAERLRAAGVPVVLSRYQGMVHGFIRMPALFRRTAVLHAELAAHLRSAFDAGP